MACLARPSHAQHLAAFRSRQQGINYLTIRPSRDTTALSPPPLVKLSNLVKFLMRIPGLWPSTPKNHGQIWKLTALVQLVDRLVFLCIWAYLCLSNNVLMRINLLGKLNLHIQESSVLKVISRSRTLAGSRNISCDCAATAYFVSPHASEDTYPNMTLFPCRLIQAALNPRSLLSKAWFELCCHYLTIGIDIGTSSWLWAQDRPLSELMRFW